ncbi:MAG: hypothetical protein JWQ07_3490 [Ramlibacter sp.]|nr:hypothetical protein [Ramlibacter sp.]
MPNDRTPLGDAMAHRFTEQKIPEPKPGRSRAAAGTKAQLDISQRPALPAHPEKMAADIEDEEDDPVIDSGPGIADGAKGPGGQRG